MKKTLLITAILFCISSYAAVFEVGSTKTYISPNALYGAGVVADGDTIYIDAETYSGTASLAVWQKNNLYIKGVGGKPHLEANGQNIWGKGIWVCAGNNITVENIEFSGATVPSENGAGIRLDGNGLTVRNCYFHDNENGILTSNSTFGHLLVEYSEFDHNGFGGGYTHNLYVGHIEQLTFRYNYSHHANVGHNLKSRAAINIITYNRIMDEDSGNSSRLIDLPNGGLSIVMGNLLMQGVNAENNNLLGYGLEGFTNPIKEIYVINNTFVNKRVASCKFIDIASGVDSAIVKNNIFTGKGPAIVGFTTYAGNLKNDTISYFNFVDEPNYDYHIDTNSLAVDKGIVAGTSNGYSLNTNEAYLHPQQKEIRTISSAIDAGAYEYNPPIDTTPIDTPTIICFCGGVYFEMFPNPIQEYLYISSDEIIEKVTVMNIRGQIVLSKKNTTKISFLDLIVGIYFVKIEFANGELAVKKVMKE